MTLVEDEGGENETEGAALHVEKTQMGWNLINFCVESRVHLYLKWAPVDSEQDSSLDILMQFATHQLRCLSIHLNSLDFNFLVGKMESKLPVLPSSQGCYED